MNGCYRRDRVSKSPTCERPYSRMILLLLNVPGIEGAEEEDDQANDALGVPPLHHPGAAVSWCLGAADIGHQTQQAGVTLSV